jgi:hypothetical protein
MSEQPSEPTNYELAEKLHSVVCENQELTDLFWAAGERLKSGPGNKELLQIIEQRLNDTSDWECLMMVRDELLQHECLHGKDHDDTPPMMYPEWIRCCIAKAKQSASLK